jgi:hypothetical protein
MKETHDTFSDWAWWLMWGLILTICISVPVRLYLFPEIYGKLSWKQELLLAVVLSVGHAVLVVRPFCKKMGM